MPAVAIVRRSPDLGPVVEALRVVHARDGYPMVWPADPARWLTPAGTLAGWVAVTGTSVVGHALLVSGDRVEHSEQIARTAGLSIVSIGGVGRLFVLPNARRTGVAAALLDHVEAEAADRGLRLALDVVDDGGTAVRFYERRGWVRVAVGPASWAGPDGERPQTAAYLCPR